jgi:hypothetical protein
MGTAAFASDPDPEGAYDATLYKYGTYGTTAQAISMGDPALNSADYDASTGELVIYVQSMVAYGQTGHILNIRIDLDGDGEYDIEGTPEPPLPDFPTTITFEGLDDLDLSEVLNVEFSIHVGNGPIPEHPTYTKADLVLTPVSAS